MTYGPCGGVTLSGACEIAPSPCIFVDRETVRWRGPEPARPQGPALDGTHEPLAARIAASPARGAQRIREVLATL